jgi:hypothetical protein
LARKGSGKEAKLAFCGNVPIENRHGLVVDTELWEATGTAERDAALVMAERIAGTGRVTVAGDKGYDTRAFIAELRHMNIHAKHDSPRRAARLIAAPRGMLAMG